MILEKMSFKYLDDMHRILSNEENIKYTGLDCSINYNSTVKHVEWLVSNKSRLSSIAIVNDDDRLIGFINIYKNLDSIEIAVMCDVKYRNKGYMYNSLCKVIDYLKEENRYKKIYAKINKKNVRSINLVKKLGFVEIEEKSNFEKEEIIIYVLDI